MNAVKKALLTKKGKLRELPVTVERLLFSAFSMSFFLIGVFAFMPLVTLLFFHGGYRMSEKCKLRYHKMLQALSAFIIRHVPGVDFSLKNTAGETFDKPSVIISNHQSHLDLMCILMLCPKLVVLTNDWVWNNPFYGHIIRMAEFYPASDGMEQNMKHIKDSVSRGYSIMIFPEGTRSPNCDILRFHKGAFVLAEELGLDIVPVFLHGVGHVLPKNDFMLRRGSIYVEIGKRIMSSDKQYGTTVRDRRKMVRGLYVTHFNEIQNERETASYWNHYLRYKYYYRNLHFKIENMLILKRHQCFSKYVDDGEAYPSILVNQSPYWQFAWLYSLVHKSTQVYMTVNNYAYYDILTRDILLPNNLHILYNDGSSCSIPDAVPKLAKTFSIIKDEEGHIKLIVE